MFSATKFVVAGVIVALFGGFLLSGVLTQQNSDEPLPPVGASASIEAEATAEVESTEPESPLESDLLPGVDLVTEEVEPGVHRVVSDGIRDLSREIGAHPWFDRKRNMAYAMDAYRSDISIAPDGSVWYFGPDGSYRIGDASRAIPDQSEPLTPSSIDWGPDGTAWGTRGQLASLADGSWTIHEDFPRAQLVYNVGVAPDGVVWALSGSGKKQARVSRLDADGWTHIDGVGQLDVASGDTDTSLKPGHDGDVWLVVGHTGKAPALAHFDGSEWSFHEPAGVPPDSRPRLIDMAADGSLWAYFAHAGGDYTGTGNLGSYQDGEWTVFGPEDGAPEAGGFLHSLGFPGLIEAAPDGRLWLTLRGDYERTETECDGVASFDGQTWTRFLADQCVYGLDAAEDGTLWVLAGEPGRDDDAPGYSHTYVITPEAVVATEPVATEPPSVDAPAEADSTSTTSPDLLPGVDLVTEEVEPGVFRVLSDGVRDLGWGHGGARDGDGIVHAGLDGSVVLSFTNGSPCNKKHCVGYRLGETETFSTRHERLTIRTQAVGPDGTIWGYAFRQGDGSQDLRSWDGDRWVVARKREDELGGVNDVAFGADGNVWATWRTSILRNAGAGYRFAQRTDEGWRTIRDYETYRKDTPGFLRASPSGELVLFSDGNEVYRVTGTGIDALREPVDVPFDGGKSWLGLAEDGTEWWHLGSNRADQKQVGRFDGSSWEVFDVPSDVSVTFGADIAPDGALWIGSGFPGYGYDPSGLLRLDGGAWTRFFDDAWVSSFDIATDGRVWALVSGPDEFESVGLYVITPEAVAATE